MRLSCCTLTGLCIFILMAGPAVAQDNAPGPAVVYVPAENVRLDYARVLNVEPVYQTLRASRSEMRCEEVAAPKPPIKPEEEGRWARITGSVKDLFTRDEPEPKPAEPIKPNCRMVPVQREFRRPIAYDVDYVYQGTKYRSRLAEDPGNRLRIRISVTPQVPGQAIALP